tara:strand:+ start:100 stop:348 length:249 start_codon:yes stop_codon:yes gene_type:complete
MGEARKRSAKGLSLRSKNKPKVQPNQSSRIVEWFPVTKKQRDQFILLSIRGSWIGIGCLVVLWLVVRFVGPSFGWWVPADVR